MPVLSETLMRARLMVVIFGNLLKAGEPLKQKPIGR
jgi:hypothetical protein